MFRAAALLGEPCTLTHHGRTLTHRDIARPDRLNDLEARAATEILTWRCMAALDAVGVPYALLNEWSADVGPLLEFGDGFTLGCEYLPRTPRRLAEHWHAYDPEGEPIAEGVTMHEAILALWQRISVADMWRRLLAAAEASR